jgi:hypothetical protein
MIQAQRRILLTMTALLFLFAACAPAQPTVTQEPVDISDEVATSVALTVAAQNTQTAEAIPPATNTPLATQTPEAPPTLTPILPTSTPLAPPTATLGPAGTPLPRPEYACSAINRRPFDQTVFRPNAEFDIVWTIVNTGTKTMAAGLDLKYHSGPKMTTTSRVELPALKPGEQYTVDFDAIAPNKQGLHVMTYLVDGRLCFPYTAIIVER